MAIDRRDIYLRGLGLALVAAALILFMSALSYSPNDPPNPDVPESLMVRNVCGIVGAYLAWAFRLFFGTGTYLIVLLMAIIGGLLVVLHPLADRKVRGIGAALFLLSWCALVALFFRGGSMPGGPGGLIGHLISESILRPIGLGGYIVALLGMLLGALLAADAWVLWLGRKSVDVLTMQGRPAGAPAPARIPAPETPTAEPATPATAAPAANGAATTAEGRLAQKKELLRKRLEEEGRLEVKTETPTPAAPLSPQEPATEKAVRHAPPPFNEAPTVVAKDREKEKEPRRPRPSKKSDDAATTGDYRLPALDLLDPVPPRDARESEESLEQKRKLLERTLEEFGIAAQVVEIDRGPVITTFELELAPGVKSSQIANLADDLARALRATSIRVVAPIPGKSTVGVEVPNAVRETVLLRELIESNVLQRKRMMLPMLLGKDASGEPLVSDLSQMPHLLIAGATGSGKSVCMNTIIQSILITQSPYDVKLLMIDPKMVELSAYKEIPHLMAPVVTDAAKAASVLEWATRKMDERYSMMANVGARNIAAFNALGEKEIRKRLDVGEEEDMEGFTFHMPYIILLIDELADLMLVARKEVENSISRLTAKSRAVGMHLIVATQRPSTDVVTGLIKANIPTRIAFQTASRIDSAVIIGGNGAEKLLGRGDLLFLPPGTAQLIRGQGAYTSDEEIRRVVACCVEQARPHFEEELMRPEGIDEAEAMSQDPLFEEAARIIIESRRGSVSLLQRKLGIGYSRASRLVDLMADAGIVGDYKGSQAREVLMTLEEWDEKHGPPQQGDG